MKKILFFSLLCVAIVVMFSSCKDNDDPDFLGAKVKVKVENILDMPKEGTTVYLYKDKAVTQETLPGDAKKMAVTNAEGIATFDLDLTELNVLESKTTLYFAVFYSDDGTTMVAGSTGVILKRNETKEVNIEIPL